MENRNTVSEMVKKMMNLVCNICEKENATPAELAAVAGIANVVINYYGGVIN